MPDTLSMAVWLHGLHRCCWVWCLGFRVRVSGQLPTLYPKGLDSAKPSQAPTLKFKLKDALNLVYIYIDTHVIWGPKP